MANRLRLRPLTALALFCRAAVGFPVWLTVLSFRTGLPAAHMVCCGVLIGCALAVMLWKRFTDRHCSPRTAFFLTGLGLLLSAAAGTLLLLSRIPDAAFIAAALALLTAATALYGAGRAPDQLFTTSHLAVFLTFTALDGILIRSSSLPIPADFLFGGAAAVCICWLLLTNQFMLNRLVSRRSDTAGEVPPEIRKSNLRMVALTVGLGTAVFLFRRPIFGLFSMFGDALTVLIRAAFRGIAAVVRWLSGDDSIAASDPVPQEDAAMPQPEGGSPLWSLLLLLFVPIVILIWRNLLSDWIFDLRERWQRFRRRMAAKRAKAAPAAAHDDAEYTDTETDARPDPSVRKRHRSWSRAVRAWNRQPDSDRKFYAGYTLMLTAPAWGSEPPQDAETAGEIRERWRQSHGDTLGTVTADLHADRYAEAGLPDTALADAAEALAALRNLRKG